MMIKDFLKDKFLILKVRDQFSPAVQIGQRSLYHHYKSLLRSGNLPSLSETGYRVFSQFEEDGKLLFIFSIIGMGDKTFVEIGSDDGVNSNSANLYFNFGWSGLFIDGNSKSINRGKKFFAKYPHPWLYKPTFICARVTRENINQLYSARSSYVKSGEAPILEVSSHPTHVLPRDQKLEQARLNPCCIRQRITCLRAQGFGPGQCAKILGIHFKCYLAEGLGWSAAYELCAAFTLSAPQHRPGGSDQKATTGADPDASFYHTPCEVSPLSLPARR